MLKRRPPRPARTDDTYLDGGMPGDAEPERLIPQPLPPEPAPDARGGPLGADTWLALAAIALAFAMWAVCAFGLFGA